MSHLPSKLLVLVATVLFSSATSLVSARALDAESDAWSNAMTAKQLAMKQGTGHAQAAAAFEAFAKTYPDSAKAREAWIEAGVCWLGEGRGLQVLHRNPPNAQNAMENALVLFKRFVDQYPDDPSAPRAQYMRGAVSGFMNDLESAEKEYSTAIERYAKDEKYFARALANRATVRRHLLRYDLALEDLHRYQKEVKGGSEEAESVARQLRLATLVGTQPPVLQSESWVQGDPLELDKLKGEVVGVYFFASWCPNCNKEREYMNDLFQRYSGAGFHIIGVVDHSEGQTKGSMQAYLAKSPVLFPVMMDAAIDPAKPEAGGKTTTSYLGSKIPDLVLIDRAGKIRWRDSPSVLNDWTLEALLSEKP